MIIPSPPQPWTVMGCTIELAGQGMSENFRVHFATEGGGFYPVIDAADCVESNSKRAHSIAFNPDELTALAKWCAEVCHRLDIAGERNETKESQ